MQESNHGKGTFMDTAKKATVETAKKATVETAKKATVETAKKATVETAEASIGQASAALAETRADEMRASIDEVEGASPSVEGDAPVKAPYLQNRELSWLTFNERVLDQGADETVPLLERLNFSRIEQLKSSSPTIIQAGASNRRPMILK